MTEWPDGPGPMARYIRTHDWASTSFGPIAAWPQSLRSLVDLMLNAPGLAIIGWGPDFSVLFNDALALLTGDGVEGYLGRPFREYWPDSVAHEILAEVRAGRAHHRADVLAETPHRAEQPRGWFTSSCTPVRSETGAVIGFYLAAFETTDRVLAERALSAREMQQAYLLRLSDALRPLADPAAIQGEACRLLGEHLDTDHAYYVAIREREGISVIERDYNRNGAPSFVGTYSLAVLERVMPLYRKGLPIVIADMGTTDLIREPERSVMVINGVGALIAIPLVKNGELSGALTVAQGRAHRWSEADVAFVAETGERIWAAVERAEAEARVRKADARLRTMANAAPALIWETDSAGTISVNEQYLTFLGASFETIAGSGWTSFIHPDDLDAYVAVYRDAYARRRPFVHETRVRRADGEYRWLNHSGRPLGADGYVGISIDVTERHLAEERLKRNNALLTAINRIFGTTLGAATEEELAYIALEVASELTESPIGLVAMNDAETNRLDTMATIDRGALPGKAEERSNRVAALECAIRNAHDPKPGDRHGAIATGAADIVLSVPLKKGEALVGVVGLAGRPGGYRREDREAAQALAPAIRHALLSKRAEAQLRESESRFREFAHASSDVLWIVDAETFRSEFASPALEPVFGVPPEAIRGDARRWATHIVPEDRASTFAQLERVRGGEVVVDEFRILRPSDRTFRWIRSLSFPLFDEDGRVRRIGGISSDVTEMRQAEQHQRVLLAELQHRVRNIMALTRSIVMRSGERAESVGEYAALVGGRLLTLARVQSRLTRAADAGVAISAILRDEIGAQAECDDQYDLAGPEIELAPKAAEVLTLAVHELTTNARKHGALSSAGGRVSVRWRRVEHRDGPWLSFLWIECGGPASPENAIRPRGFGSELIEGMIPYELSGRGRIELTAEGARCHLEFPLKTGASILETQAPQLGRVFGGSLDLRGEADLDGHRILVAEDEFYLASDTARALEAVGATVLGPYACEAAALDGLDRETPMGAVIDTELGGSVSLALPRALAARGVPFVFLTDYDAAELPPEFAEVPRLEKPVELRRLVGTLARMLGLAPASPA